MTTDRQRELYELIKDGDMCARDELIEGFLGMVQNITKSICTDDDDYENLYQEGCIGLLEAVDKWDILKGLFSTIAYHYIWGYIHNHIAHEHRLVRFIESENMGEYDDEMFYDTPYYNKTTDCECQVADKDLVAKIITVLNPKEQKLIYLKYYCGYDANEIGEIISNTSSNVNSKLHRAFVKLRKAFEGRELI